MRLSVRQLIGRKLRRFCRSRDGLAGAEFGLAAPVMFFATIGLIELGMMMFVSTLVEGGLREASRFGITGFAPSGVSREDQIRDIIAKNTIGLVDMDSATITQQIYPSFESVGQPEPYEDANSSGTYDVGENYQDINGNGQWDADMGDAGAGGPGAVVLYVVEVDWPAMTPIFAPMMGADGKIRLRASVAVRNEPFTASSGGGGGSTP